MVVVVGIINIIIHQVDFIFLNLFLFNIFFVFLVHEKRRSAPFDQLQISHQVQEISRPLYLTMSCFAALGLLFAVICLILNIIYRNRKYKKKFSFSFLIFYFIKIYLSIKTNV